MTSDVPLPERCAIQLRDDLATGTISAVELAKACIARIEEREKVIGAWAWFNAHYALQQAKALDTKRLSGDKLGPLHGLPVAVKDIVDVGGVPTENGCPLDEGRVPETDAVVVKRLKAAGALVMGKTVTTELAFLSPSRTCNPVNVAHTPGGSSSGSAAAVADGMVPLAIGTQTGGSVIRPASFCGVTGMKPQFGAIPSKGVLVQSPRLDTLGVFARDPEGAALLASALMDERGTNVSAVLSAASRNGADTVFGFVELPGWEQVEAATKQGILGLCEKLASSLVDVSLPVFFEDAASQRATLNAAEMAFHFRHYYASGANRLGRETREEIERGQNITAMEYLSACTYQDSLHQQTEDLFRNCDVLLCPAALGAAPEGLGSTGDSIFNGVWTMAGVPAITLPLLQDETGLPMGVQLVARANDEAGLVRAARWLWHMCQS